MIIIHVVIDADDRGAVVRLPVGGNRRDRQWNPVSADEIAESVRRIGLHAEPLERQRVGGGDRLQRIESPTDLKRAEVEQLVLNDRTANAAADLMLRVALTESGRCRLIFRELEMRIAQRVT